MPRVSVIIPAYNVAPYLDECLGSLTAQDFTDWEAVCVDDGSTDGTGRLLDAWATRDPRVRVIHQENGGVSSARNAALRAAGGDLLCFLDGDDRLAPSALSRLVEVFGAQDAEVVVFGAACFPPEASTEWLDRTLVPREAHYAKFEPALAFAENTVPFIGRAACTRSLALRAQAYFDEGLRVGEDTAWMLHVYPRAHGVSLIPDRLYEYRLSRAGSAVASEEKGAISRLSQHVAVAEAVFESWEEGGFLAMYPAELAAWTMRFCGYAVLRAPSPERDPLVRRLGDLFDRHLSGQRVSGCPMRVDVAALMGIFQTSDAQGRLSASPWKVRAALLAWRLREYGVRDLVETTLGRGGSRSGSGA